MIKVCGADEELLCVPEWIRCWMESTSRSSRRESDERPLGRLLANGKVTADEEEHGLIDMWAIKREGLCSVSLWVFSYYRKALVY